MQNIDITYDNQWTGYKNYRDITNLEGTDIAAGSKNIIITDGAKAEARGGSTYLGAEGTIGVQTDPYWSIAHRIHSKYDTFVNGGGNNFPMRVYYSGEAATGDVIDVYLPDYVAGVAQTTKSWYTASQTVSPAAPLISKHRWYFAEWWDTIGEQPHLIFVAGNNEIKSWTCGYAPITAVAATTITTLESLASLGFLNAADGGSDTIIVNGVAYITDGNFTGTTTTIPAGTAGISVDEIAFAEIVNYTYPDTFAFDVCGTTNNQVYYKDWKQRTVLVSWNRNQNPSLGLTIYQGTSGLNDGVFSGTYSGTGTGRYEVTIDSINPGIDVETTEFISQNGSTSSQTGSFDTSGYTGGTGENIYELTCVANLIITGVGASMSPVAGDPAWVDQIFIGGTSGAVGVAIGGQYALSFVAPFYMLSGNFIKGETITGQATGASVDLLAIQEASFFQFRKNGDLYTALSPFNTAPTYAWQANLGANLLFSPATLLDGITFEFDLPMNYLPGDTFKLTKQFVAESPDTFSWSLNGESQASEVDITGAAQALSDGVSITFVKTVGHDRGDEWTATGFPEIQHGYRNFTFTEPDRIQGEGNIITMDSNGWTLIAQEDAMYLNAAGGEYYAVTEFEDGLNVKRLKTEPQFKALFPYLISHVENYVGTIIRDKSFNILGRLDFLELPQMKSMSDDVRFLFATGNWEDGNIIFGDTKTFFTLPKEGVVIVYDNYMKYFHAPMEFGRRVSSISFIDDKICGHSYERNETYDLFTSDLNDLGVYPIETRIVKPYVDDGDRFAQYSVRAIAAEGFMLGDPKLNWQINAGVGGCDGNPSGIIDPITCSPVDTASLGKSSLGFHGLGNSPADVIPHFKYGKTFTPTKYYLRNIELWSDALEQRWSIVSLGVGIERNKINNGNLFNINN